MPPDRPNPQEETAIDERHFVDWFEFGWAELVAYLTKHARFDAWLEKAGRKEQHG